MSAILHLGRRSSRFLSRTRSPWTHAVSAISGPGTLDSFRTALRGIAGRSPSAEGVGGFGDLSVQPSAADAAVSSLEQKIKKLEIDIEDYETLVRQATDKEEKKIYGGLLKEYGGVLKEYIKNLGKLYDEKKLLLEKQSTPGAESAEVFRERLNAIKACENTNADAFQNYSDIGMALVNDDTLKNIVNRLKEAQKDNGRDSLSNNTFFVVEGHSGVGKTQLSFALKASGLKVVHLLLSSSGDVSAQPVYTVFSDLSAVFNSGVTEDLLKFQNSNQNVFGASDLMYSAQPLRVVEFTVHVLKLLGVEMSNSESVVSMNELRNIIFQLATMNGGEGAQSLPIFVFDEVFSGLTGDASDENVRRMLFVRNVFRALGLVTVFMGTNSSAAYYLPLVTHSRDSENPWCHLITRLPKSTDATLQVLGAKDLLTHLCNHGHHGLEGFLSSCFLNSTPWLVRLFVEAARKANIDQSSHLLLDEILSHMAKSIFISKKSLRWQLSGQIRLLLSGHRDFSTAPGFERLVDKHLATPNSESTDLYVSVNNNDECYLSVDGSLSWRPCSSFSSATADPFLYLTLAGGSCGQTFSPALMIDNSRTPTLQYVDAVLKEENSNKTCLENELALKQDGNALEVIASIAMIIASHEEGTGGSPLKRFLPKLVWELLREGKGEVQFQDTLMEQFLSDRLCNLQVPYLSPVNNSWPEAMSAIQGSCFGNLKRVRDSDKIDIRVDGMKTGDNVAVISGEAKNYTKALDLKGLKAVLQRVPRSSDVHLVFCPGYQDKYFTRTKDSWLSFREQNGLQGVSLLRVCLKDANEGAGRDLVIAPLFSGSVPPQDCTRCVLFLSADSSSSPH